MLIVSEGIYWLQSIECSIHVLFHLIVISALNHINKEAKTLQKKISVFTSSETKLSSCHKNRCYWRLSDKEKKIGYRIALHLPPPTSPNSNIFTIVLTLSSSPANSNCSSSWNCKSSIFLKPRTYNKEFKYVSEHELETVRGKKYIELLKRYHG